MVEESCLVDSEVDFALDASADDGVGAFIAQSWWGKRWREWAIVVADIVSVWEGNVLSALVMRSTVVSCRHGRGR